MQVDLPALERPARRRPIIILQTDGDEVGRLSGWQPVANEQLPARGDDDDERDVGALP